MPLRFGAIGALGLAAFLTAGCSMMPFGGDEARPVARRVVAPAPLPAAPTGSVSTAALAPPPGTAIAAPAPAIVPPPPPPGSPPPSGLAALNPAVPSAAPAGPSPALATPAAAPAVALPPPPEAPAGGDVDVGRTDLLGGWTIAAAGDSCQLFMTLTTWSGGYRASTKGCNSDALKTISAWNMEGRQVQLLNDTGATVARLVPSSKTNFNGQTEGGGPVSVTR